MTLARKRRSQLKPRPPKAQTRQYRNWKGVNQTDSRTAIEDDELFWMENCVTVGKGAIQVLNAPGAAIASPGTVFSTWGFTLNATAVQILVHTDGSLAQLTTPGGVSTAIAPAGTVTTAARLTIWRDSNVLIIDPTLGYMTWDGTTFTVIDAARVGTDLAVNESRVWIANGRAVSVTAPNSFNNFTAGDGATSFIITDEAFPGNIVALKSALQQLWIVGQGAIDAVSNVASTGVAPAVVTTFAVTNIISNLGSTEAASVTGYFRSLALLAPFGIYALAGVTPQKLSDKLDGLFPNLILTGGVPAAVGVVQNLLCLFFLVRYTGTNAQAQAVAGNNNPINMLLGFTQGKWFFAVQDTSLQWITTVLVNGVAQVWGTDGTDIFRCFGAADTEPTVYKVQSKFYDYGLSTSWKQAYKAGLEVQATNNVVPVMTVDSESSSATVQITSGNALAFTNSLGQVITFTNALSQPITFLAQGLVLSRSNANIGGHYLGWTITGNDPPYRIVTTHLEYVMSREWSAP